MLSAPAHDEKREFKSREAVQTVPLQHVSLSGFSCYSPLTFSRVLHRSGFPRLSPQLTLKATFPPSAGFCSRCTSSWAGIRSGSPVSFPSLHLLFRVRLLEKKAAGRTVRKKVKNTIAVVKLFECSVPLFPHQPAGDNINTHEQWQRPFD